jgi:hypothetical protein
VTRLLAAGASVSVAPDGVADAGAGAYVVRDADASMIDGLTTDLGITFQRLRREPDVALRPMEPLRIGIYKSWQANMDEGWTRWVMDTYDFPVDTLHDAQIRNGDLSRYQAIIIPDQRPNGILHGYGPGTRPDSMVGGIGLQGMLRLKEYVEGGGRLIAFDGATQLLIDELGLPVRNVVDGLPSERFFVPGTLIRMTVDTGNPLGYGMPEEAAASFVRSAAFSAAGPGVEVVARYADQDPVLSGWALGEEMLGNRAAEVRVRIGSGDVVLFGFRPQFRGQPRGTFKLLFNALHGAAAGLQHGSAMVEEDR